MLTERLLRPLALRPSRGLTKTEQLLKLFRVSDLQPQFCALSLSLHAYFVKRVRSLCRSMCSWQTVAHLLHHLLSLSRARSLGLLCLFSCCICAPVCAGLQFLGNSIFLYLFFLYRCAYCCCCCCCAILSSLKVAFSLINRHFATFFSGKCCACALLPIIGVMWEMLCVCVSISVFICAFTLQRVSTEFGTQ